MPIQALGVGRHRSLDWRPFCPCHVPAGSSRPALRRGQGSRPAGHGVVARPARRCLPRRRHPARLDHVSAHGRGLHRGDGRRAGPAFSRHRRGAAWSRCACSRSCCRRSAWCCSTWLARELVQLACGRRTAFVLLAVNPTFVFWSRQGIFVTSTIITLSLGAILCLAHWRRRRRRVASCGPGGSCSAWACTPSSSSYGSLPPWRSSSCSTKAHPCCAACAAARRASSGAR